MWNFERKEIEQKAIGWCIEHKIEPNPLGIVIALDALEMLNDPAVEHRLAHGRASLCPECGVIQVVEHLPTCSHYETPAGKA